MIKTLSKPLLIFLSLFVLSTTTCAEAGSEAVFKFLGTSTEEVGDKLELGKTVKIDLFAEATGDVAFTYDWEPKTIDWSIDSTTGAKFVKQKKRAFFEWSPIPSDVQGQPISITFIATDQNKKQIQKKYTFQVVFGEGGPVFDTQKVHTQDPKSQEPVTFKVKIKHPSCQNKNCVQLRLKEDTAPAGSTFTHHDPLVGTFTWQPTAEQRQKRLTDITFLAKDTKYPEVEYTVSVLMRSTGDNTTPPTIDDTCSGENVLNHVPLNAKRDIANENYKVEFTTSETFEEAVVYWNIGRDHNNSPLAWREAPMTLVDGKYVGEIESVGSFIDPNVGVIPVNYDICAYGEDKYVCVPKNGIYTFLASFPEAPTCLNDDNEPNDSMSETSSLKTEKYTFFMACPGDNDFIKTTSSPGVESKMVFIYNKGAQLNFEATGPDGNSVPVEKSDCTGLASIDTTSASGGDFTVKVSGENIPYRAQKLIVESSTTDRNCIDKANEPNDSGSQATTVTSGQSLNAEICEPTDIDIYKLTATAGQKITVNALFKDDEGDLEMFLFDSSQKNNLSDITAEALVRADTPTDNESIEYVVETGGDFYVKVFGYQFEADQRSSYAINFDVSQPAPQCDNDPYSLQDNHSQDNAALWVYGQNIDETGLEICKQVDDWYKRAELTGVRLYGQLFADPSKLGSIRWRIYDIEGNLLSTAELVDNSYYKLDYIPPRDMFIFHKINATLDKIEYDLAID